MKRNRFTEEQIIGALKEHESGAEVGQLCRRLGISRVTLYAWKKKYGGMDVSEAKRLRKLEDENGRLKRAVADLTLDNQVLKDIVSRKW
jgi:putative transposase